MHAAPDKRARPATALLGGSPGGVWARDIPVHEWGCPWSPAWKDRRPHPGDVSASEMSVRRRQ
jgi:hypothetical protein